MKGYIHAYWGDGKGKTTAAVGLAVRMAGAGGTVAFFQFLKADRSSERRILEKINGITVLPGMKTVKFYQQMTEEEKKSASLFYQKRLNEIAQTAEQFDMVVLDEFLVAVDKGILPYGQAEAFLKNHPSETELVLTGRTKNEAILKLCDYVTQMKKIKHPYDQSVQARKGIEF